MFHPVPGGAVEASSRGVAALGRDESEALVRLGELLDWWPGTERDEIIPLTAAPADSPAVTHPASVWPMGWLERESA